MTRRNLIVLVLVSALILTGCATFEIGNLNPTKRRAKFITTNPDTQFKAAIKRGDLVRGMTEAEVVASIGGYWTKSIFLSHGILKKNIGFRNQFPSHFARLHEQWVLPHNSMRDARYAYLYFQNGLLASWQSRVLR